MGQIRNSPLPFFMCWSDGIIISITHGVESMGVSAYLALDCCLIIIDLDSIVCDFLNSVRKLCCDLVHCMVI